MEETKLPDFKGKIVLLYTRNAPRAIQDGIVLEYASFEKYDSRLFLNGRVPSVDDKGTYWVSNLKAGLAWEDVSHFIVFDSRDEYISRVANVKESFLQKIIGR